MCFCSYSAFVLFLRFVPDCPVQEENEDGQLLGFNAVATKLLAIVTAPIHSALLSQQTEVGLPCMALPPYSLLTSVYVSLLLSVLSPSYRPSLPKLGSSSSRGSVSWPSA